MGRTFGIPANGAVSNMALTPYAVYTLRRELREGGYDVVHIHEPVVPILGWDALCLVRAMRPNASPSLRRGATSSGPVS